MTGQTYMISHHRFEMWLRTLLVFIVGTMALGAGVRAMNAGLSCPDWPLCFGQVIPDFHPAVWFEFVHRACVGVMTVIFLLCAFYAYKKADIPRGVRRAATIGLLVLIFQITFGALTVKLQVRSYIVTTHLALGTLFFLSVYWMIMALHETVDRPHGILPSGFVMWAKALPYLVFAQLIVGGFVASTYAGSVCVDWPKCNGQWFPTWWGAIGLQIVHRMIAYALAVSIVVFAVLMQRSYIRPWVTPQFLRLSRWAAFVVCMQVVVGVLNLLWYIPAPVTVLHQTMAVILLAICTRLSFVVGRIRS
jgi:cytochrome c oxidase assembly protein subunit 15